MSVDLNEENVFVNNNIPVNKTGGIIGFLIKKGIASSEKQASSLLIFILILCVVATVIVLNTFVYGNGFGENRIDRERLKRTMELNQNLKNQIENVQRDQRGIPLINQ